MTVESGQGKQPRSLPSFQIIFGTIIALIGGGGKFVSARLMDEQSHIPVTIGDVHLQLNQFEVNWVSNAIIVIGALFVFTATRRG